MVGGISDLSFGIFVYVDDFVNVNFAIFGRVYFSEVFRIDGVLRGNEFEE